MTLFIAQDTDSTFVVRPGENTLQAAASALLAEGWADAAALSAATAEAAAGPTYASTAAGLAATTSGQAFAVDAGGGLVSVYLNSSGTAVLQRTLATTGALAGSGGGSFIGLSDGRTAESAINLTNGRFYNGSATNVLLRNPNTGATRVHIEPNGYPNGTAAKTDWMLDPYEDDGATVGYRIVNRFAFAARDGTTPYGGFVVDSVKGTGRYFGIYPAWVSGFSDGGACPEAMFYVDFSDPAPWRTPYKDAWRAGRTGIVTGDYISASNKLYQAASSGTTGSTIPSHSTGTVSDGGVSWTFVRDFAAASNDIKPVKVFGSHSVNLSAPGSSVFDRPKLGTTLKNIPVQFARGAVVWNNSSFSFLDGSGAIAWNIKTANLTDDLSIETAAGTERLRLDATGKFVQIIGLSVCSSPVTPADGDTTPSIRGVRTMIFGNTGATSVTTFDDGVPLQEVFVRATNGNTTLVHSASLRLVGKANRTLTANDCLMFQMSNAGTVATEVGYRD